MTNLDYLFNKDAVAKQFGENYFVDKKLHFKIIERGTILPHKHLFVNGRWTWGFGGIVDNRNEFVQESFVHSGAGAAYTPTEEIWHSPATVVYLGLFFPVWGHAITDNIRRLWFLTSEVFKKYFKDCPLVYLPWSNGGGYLLSNRKIFGDCLRFWKSTSKNLSRLLNRHNSRTSSCPMNLFSSKAATENLLPNIVR